MWVGMLAAQLVCAALMLHAVLRTDWAEQAVRASVLTGGRGGGVIVVADVKSGHADAAKVKMDNGMLVVTVLT
jgi:MATE family multidrug resistance protein